MPKFPGSSLSDGQLLDHCRAGDGRAFGILWERHRHAAHKAARGLAPTLDADDLVSEAYLKILELVQDGRGPRGAFRPYLYQVIRTCAVDQFRSPELASDELDQIPDLHEAGPWEDNAFDLNAVATAFATLDERWQAALWYAEVEGLPPRRVAPLLGLSANAASALTARAREALQSAWVEAHVNRELNHARCVSTVERLQRFQRGKLTKAASREVEEHLETCGNCRAAAAEASTLNRKLGLILAGALLGGGGVAALLQQLGIASTAGSAATASSAGALRHSGNLASTSSAGVITGAVVAGATVAVAAAVAIGSALLPFNAGSPESSPAAGAPASPAPTPAPAFDRPTAVAPHVTKPPASRAEESLERPGTPRPEDPPSPRDPGPSPRDPGPELPDPPKPPRPDPPRPGGPPLGTDEPGDPSLSPGFVCAAPQIDPSYPEGLYLVGEANAYGLINVRVTQGTAPAVPLIAPQFDPAREGIEPGNVFVNGVFTDLYGNSFTSGFFTGTDPGPGFGWFGATSLTPLSQWPGLVDQRLEDVRIEIRLVTPDGRASPWTLIDPVVHRCF